MKKQQLLLTYNEAILLIKKEIALYSIKPIKNTRQLKTKTSIKSFCLHHELNYNIIVNALNSKEENHPHIVLDLLTLLHSKHKITHSKVNLYEII